MEDGKVMNKLNVLYEDNHIIVVEKEFNVLSQGDNSGDVSLLDMVKDYVKVKYNKPGNVYIGLVHRLDRPVGGVMVFARTSKAASRLSDQVRSKSFIKKYYAIVSGKVDADTYIDKLEKLDNGNTIVSSNGKESILSFDVVDYNKEYNCSLVDISLKTGRHHQIRVQFASRGHYLLGDQRYGVEDKTQIALFAHYLSFIHPITKEKMEFELLPKNVGHWTKFTIEK